MGKNWHIASAWVLVSTQRTRSNWSIDAITCAEWYIITKSFINIFWNFQGLLIPCEEVCILSIHDHPRWGVWHVRFVFQLSHQTLWQNWWDLCSNYLIQLCLRIDEYMLQIFHQFWKEPFIYTDHTGLEALPSNKKWSIDGTGVPGFLRPVW